MRRCQTLLFSMLLVLAAAGYAADENRPFSLVCDGQKLLWQDNRPKPVISLGRIRIAVDPRNGTLQLEGLAIGAGKGLATEPILSHESLRGLFAVRVVRKGRVYPRLSLALNRLSGEVSIGSLPETGIQGGERTLLHFVGQCRREAQTSARS